MSHQNFQYPADDPPPYGLMVSHKMQGGTGVNEDGRIDVDLDSKACKAVAKLIRLPDNEELNHPPTTPTLPEARSGSTS
ncbi:hypothetical protein N7447_002551 [Penicillium robsamsonii]|uniref:uncharacterized protein n=1 Tax=Penicillium robsamsonii TaxID=1792511 RepID=UPI0025478346|nr:uncharacterized protein N7447_002551 [Penicillium robsamsonii]KAJ5836525.1 hypothetical protein N7447_002551 [Penicillium robsamsonii]